MVKLSYAHLALVCAITGSSVVASPLPSTLDRRGKDALHRVQSGRVTKPNSSGGLGGYQPTHGRDGKDPHERYWQKPGTPPNRDWSPGRSQGSAPMSGVEYGRRDLFESIDDLVERDDFELERRGKDALHRVQSGRITKPNTSGGLGGYQPTQGRDGKDPHERYWQKPGTPPSRPYSPGRSGGSGPMSGVEYGRRDLFESIDDLVERDDIELERRGKDALHRVQSGRITKPNSSGGLGGYQPTQGRDGKDPHERYWQKPGTPPSRPYSPGRSGGSGPMSGVEYGRRDLFESIDDLVERDDSELERREKDPLRRVQSGRVTKPNSSGGLGGYQPTLDQHERYWRTPGTPPNRDYSPGRSLPSAPMSGVSGQSSGHMSGVQYH